MSSNEETVAWRLRFLAKVLSVPLMLETVEACGLMCILDDMADMLDKQDENEEEA